MRTSRSRPSAAALLRDAGVILGVFTVLGVLAGVVWPHLVDPVLFTRTRTGITTDELGLERRFDTDGWFAVLGFVGGLLGGLVLTAWRHTHEVVSLLLVTAGAFLASWVAAVLGTAVGPSDPQTVLAHADVGATAPDRVVVTSAASYHVWPLGAVIGGLIVLWGPGGQPRSVHHRSEGSDGDPADTDRPPAAASGPGPSGPAGPPQRSDAGPSPAD